MKIIKSHRLQSEPRDLNKALFSTIILLEIHGSIFGYQGTNKNCFAMWMWRDFFDQTNNAYYDIFINTNLLISDGVILLPIKSVWFFIQ